MGSVESEVLCLRCKSVQQSLAFGVVNLNEIMVFSDLWLSGSAGSLQSWGALVHFFFSLWDSPFFPLQIVITLSQQSMPLRAQGGVCAMKSRIWSFCFEVQQGQSIGDIISFCCWNCVYVSACLYICVRYVLCLHSLCVCSMPCVYIQHESIAYAYSVSTLCTYTISVDSVSSGCVSLYVQTKKSSHEQVLCPKNHIVIFIFCKKL